MWLDVLDAQDNVLAKGVSGEALMRLGEQKNARWDNPEQSRNG